MKKFITVCLSLALVLSLAVPAAAQDAAEDNGAEWTLEDWDGKIRFPDNLDPGFMVDEDGNRLWTTAGASQTDAAQDASGQVKVMLNGEDVTFPNASPEISGGRTMVPMRAVLEALGAEVDYDGDTKTVTATLGDTALTHVIGTDKIAVKDGEDLTMDTASYVKSGSTLVPLRFFSQALGYEVYWDNGQRTAVVIDKAAAVEKIDKNFSTFNDILAKQTETPDLSGNLALDMDLSGEIKLLDGTFDEALPFSGEASALYSSEAMNINGSMDLSAIIGLLAAEDETTAAMLTPLLEDLSFQMIYGEDLWMQMPALTSLLRLSGMSIPAGDAWLKIGGVETSAMDTLDTASMEAGTIGGALYDAVEYMDADNPVNICRDLTEAADLLTTLMGDDTFTKNGDDYTWKLDDPALLTALIGEEPDAFSMSMERKADGSGSFSLELEIADIVALSLSGETSDKTVSVKCKLTVAEVCEVTMQSTASVKESGTAPVSAPPAGATVIDLDELTSDLGVIGGADGPTAVFTTKA